MPAAAETLADLMEISSHVEAAVLFDSTGAVAASTFSGEGRAAALARIGVDLFAAAAALRRSGPPAVRVEASFPGGMLFAVRDGDRLIAATTTPESPSALVVYDLRTALRAAAADEEPAKRKPARRRAKKPEDADVAT